jgi:mono/diheme cytochrome c family protein
MKSRLAVVLATALFLGCFRGTPSDKPPIHIIRDMLNEPRYNPQAESRFFPDSAAMREPVPGTVARGYLWSDSIYYYGLDSKGNYVRQSPIPVTMELLERGRQRFDIYCSPCHGRLGDGQGMVVQRGFIPPPTFHSDRIRGFPDGEIFDVISNGVRNMPSYGDQVQVRDRWAIVSYVRALQLSQNAPLEDVPEQLRGTLK